jgi:hypothetical protein
VPMASRLGSENFGRGTDPGTRVEGVACAKTTPVTADTCTFDCMNKAIQCMGFKHKSVVTYLYLVNSFKQIVLLLASSYFSNCSMAIDFQIVYCCCCCCCWPICFDNIHTVLPFLLCNFQSFPPWYCYSFQPLF